VFGRVARMSVEIDLGVPLRDPRSQSDYVQAVRQLILVLNHSSAGAIRSKSKTKTALWPRKGDLDPN